MEYDIIAITPRGYGNRNVRRIDAKQMAQEQAEHARWATTYWRGYQMRWNREEYWFLPREVRK